jgi:hypothetical protein
MASFELGGLSTHDVPSAPRTARPGALRRAGSAATNSALVGLMIAGSIAIWTVIPVGVLWIASQATASKTALSFGSLMIVILGIPAGMAACGKGLAATARLYERRTGTGQRRDIPVWRRCLGDTQSRISGGPLEATITIAVLLVMIAFLVWFFCFAGSSLIG